MKTKEQIIEIMEGKKARSAWSKGVKAFALDMLEGLEKFNPETIRQDLLKGASNWKEYSYGGCFYVYDADIAEALCTPSELKRTDGGRLPPNSNETWLDCQARALSQACELIKRAIH